jgi:hypothetical protein
MKRILTLIGLTLGLSGGVAAADSRIHHGPIIERGHGPVVEHRGGINYGHGPVVVNRGPVVRYNDVRFRPAPRIEHFEIRGGYDWVAGQWIWTGYEWTWIGGHYVRC